MKAAKIDDSCVKMSRQYFQNLNQVNLLLEFEIKIIKAKVKIVATPVKIFLIICWLNEWFWITFTLTHQNIENQAKYESWVNLKILL